MALRFSVASQDFGRQLRRSLAAAARTGVGGVRLDARKEVRPEEFTDTALRQLRLSVERTRMQVAGLMFSTRHALGDAEYIDQRIDGIRRAMPLARKLATDEMVIRVGAVPDPGGKDAPQPAGRESNQNVDSLANPFSFVTAAAPGKPMSDAERFQMLVEILNDLAAHGNHVGCRLQLQLAGYDVARIRILMERVKTGPVGIVFDPATCVMTGRDPVQVYRDLHHLVGTVRCRDALKDVDGAGIECPVGQGIVDWPQLMATFDEASFTGWCCVERTGGDDRPTEVMSGVQYFRDLLPGAIVG